MILTLNKLKDRPILLFILGALVGTVAEYLMSYICEKIFHFIWWDYSENFLNINGRVCLYFSVMWGTLAIFLIKYINPFLNKTLEKISETKHYKLIKSLFKLLIVFLIFDIIATIVALRIFYINLDNKFNISNNNKYLVNRVSNVEKNASNFEKEMLLIYPNIRIVDNNQKIYFVDSLLKNIKTYYVKIFTK